MGEIPYRRYSPRANMAGFGEIPEPTVIVWMGGEELLLSAKSQACGSVLKTR